MSKVIAMCEHLLGNNKYQIEHFYVSGNTVDSLYYELWYNDYNAY